MLKRSSSAAIGRTSAGAATGPAVPAAEAVFVDLTGRRGRWVTVVGVVVAALLIAYVVAVVASVLVADPVPDGALPPAAGSARQSLPGPVSIAPRCPRSACARS